jgi:general secretion pathway protein L
VARILGVSIEPRAVRGALVRTAFRKFEVERYLQVPLTRPAEEAARAIDLEEALQGLMRALSVPPDTVVAELPGEQVALRDIRLPASAAKHIADVLPFELESVLPISVDTSVIDYQPVEPAGQEVHLLAAAALRERIAERLRELSSGGFDPSELAAGGAALDGLVALVPEIAGPGPFVVADIGTDATDLCVLQSGTCRLARTISTGIGHLPGGAEELWRGMQRTVAAFRSTGGPPVERIYVAGEGARAEGACEWIADRLEIETAHLPLPSTPTATDADRLVFARAAALAGRSITGGKRINLRRGEFAPIRAAGALRRHTGLFAACAVAVLVSLVFSLYSRRSVLADERDSLQLRLTRVTEEIFGTAVSDPQQVERLLGNPRSNDPLPRFDAFDALDAISNAIASDIVHDVRRLRVEVGDEKHEGRIEMQGSLGTIEQRDAVVTQLEKHDCFDEVEKGKTTPARDRQRINYQIEAVIRCPGDARPQTKRTSRRRPR